jgi:hypothetical protein
MTRCIPRRSRLRTRSHVAAPLPDLLPTPCRMRRDLVRHVHVQACECARTARCGAPAFPSPRATHPVAPSRRAAWAVRPVRRDAGQAFQALEDAARVAELSGEAQGFPQHADRLRVAQLLDHCCLITGGQRLHLHARVRARQSDPRWLRVGSRTLGGATGRRRKRAPSGTPSWITTTTCHAANATLDMSTAGRTASRPTSSHARR